MKTRKKAFTLIELLVVISIIALLVSILLPALNSARLTAQRTVCAVNQRSIGLALHQYSNDFKGKLPPMYPSDHYGDPWHSYCAYEDSIPKPPPNDDEYEPLNLAPIYETGSLDTPVVFYCPSMETLKVNTMPRVFR